MAESDLIAWLRTRLSHTFIPHVHIGAGPDDCAFIRLPDGSLLAATTDTITEGTHFTPDTPPADIGWKAMACSLSDLAASGCSPYWSLVSASFRRGLGDTWIRACAEGLIACAEAYGMPIVGGDTTSADVCTCITVSAAGLPMSKSPLLRSDARPGDIVAVTGELGGSIRGKHLRFSPRLFEIQRILSLVDVHACMDITDGLALDLSRMMKESECGANVVANDIPVSPACHDASSCDDISPLDHALHDGEDFELLLTLAPDAWATLSEEWPDKGTGVPVTAIGTVTTDRSITITNPDNEIVPLDCAGYEHDF